MTLPSLIRPILYGTTTIEGALGTQLEGAALVATGQSTVVATVAIALTGATATATGIATSRGNLSTQLAGAALVATGQSTVLATVAIALTGATMAATTQLGETAIEGTLATQLAGAALVARGQNTVLATVSIALPGVSMASTTQLGGPIEGALSTQLAGATLQALGQAVNMLTLLSDITDRLIRIENQLIADTRKGATRYKRLIPGTEVVILDKDVAFDPLTGFTLTEHQEPPP